MKYIHNDIWELGIRGFLKSGDLFTFNVLMTRTNNCILRLDGYVNSNIIFKEVSKGTHASNPFRHRTPSKNQVSFARVVPISVPSDNSGKQLANYTSQFQATLVLGERGAMLLFFVKIFLGNDAP
eukprot:9220955-Ditylum_brightwellii.AAC.1